MPGILKNMFLYALIVMSAAGCIQVGDSMDYSDNLDDNILPVINPQSVSVPQNGEIIIALSATDPDSNELSWQTGTAPSRGTLSASSGNMSFRGGTTFLTTVTYFAAPGELGQDSFTYSASDGLGSSTPVVVTVSITSGGYVTSRPAAYPVSASVIQDGPSIPITLSGTDPDGDDLAWELIDAPGLGTLSAMAGTMSRENGIATAVVNYTPDNGVNGTDGFTYVVYDGILYSYEATVSVTINPLNTAPLARNVGDAYCDEDTVLRDAPLNATDPEGDDLLYYAGEIAPSHGTVIVDSINGTFTYTPDPDFSGEDVFSYYVTDGEFTSNEATVTVTVENTPDAPVVSDMNVVCRVNTPLIFHLNGSDVDTADMLVFEILEYPHDPAFPGIPVGTLTQPDPEDTAVCQYIPEADFSGELEFSYSVSDGDSTVFARVSVEVTRTAVWHVNDNGPAHGDGTDWGSAFRNIQDAIDAAIAGDTIRVAEGTYRRRNSSDAAVITLKDGIILEGGYYYNLLVLGWSRDYENHASVLDGENAVNHVAIGAGRNGSEDPELVTILDGFTLQGGNARAGGSDDSGAGMLIRDAGTVVRDCSFVSNAAAGSGGAVYITGDSEPYFSRCDFSGNRAYGHGGAIFIDNAVSASVTGCTFTGNRAADDGVSATENMGGALCVLGTLVLRESVFGFEDDSGGISGGNSADRGGAVYTEFNTVTVGDTEFFDNEARLGGALYSLENDEIVLNGVNFSGNRAIAAGSSGRGGAAFFNHVVSVDITASTWENNTAPGSYGRGGAIYAYYCGNLNDSGSTFSGNISGREGGAVWAFHVSSVRIDGVGAGLFNANNSTRFGGALYLSECGPVVLENLSLTGNSAAYGGGAIYAEKNIQLSLTGAAVQNNSATGISGKGGGLYLEEYCYARVALSRLQNNNANHFNGAGGAVYSSNGSVVDMVNALITGNEAFRGGALYNSGGFGFWLNFCTVADNNGRNEGSALYLENGTGYITNSIFYGNEYDVDSETGQILFHFLVNAGTGTLTFACSFIERGWPGMGNIDGTAGIDPEDPRYGTPWFSEDYYLASGSPCIDHGDPGTSDHALAVIEGLHTQGGLNPPVDITWDEMAQDYAGDPDMGFHR